MMTGGFATIAAGVMAVYIDFGVPAVHLIAASVMAAPGALVISKLLFPEEGEPETGGNVRAQVARPWVNPVDAAASGAADGVKLAINVAAMLIGFLALLALVNGVLGWVGGLISVPGLSLEWLFARLLAPVAWLLGIEWAEAGRVGVLLGKKTILNEFIAFSDMKVFLDNAKAVAAGTAVAGSVPVLSAAPWCWRPTPCAASPTSARSASRSAASARSPTGASPTSRSSGSGRSSPAPSPTS